jgi:hypothetical protein
VAVEFLHQRETFNIELSFLPSRSQGPSRYESPLFVVIAVDERIGDYALVEKFVNESTGNDHLSEVPVLRQRAEITGDLNRSMNAPV